VLRLEWMPPGFTRLELELVEDRLRLRIALGGLPLCAQPCVHLGETIIRIENAAHHELRRDRAVPLIGLQTEGDVVLSRAPVPIELRSLAERDRPAGIVTVVMYPEAKVSTLADGRKVTELATRRQQRNVGIAEPEGREPT